MLREEIRARVVDVLSNQANVPADQIKDEFDLVKDLSRDSIDVVEIVMSLEENFNTSLPDEETGTVRTVEDLVNLMDRVVNK
jgi:acyl carrier protein